MPHVEAETSPPRVPSVASVRSGLSALPVWKKWLFAFAAASVIGGACLSVAEAATTRRPSGHEHTAAAPNPVPLRTDASQDPTRSGGQGAASTTAKPPPGAASFADGIELPPEGSASFLPTTTPRDTPPIEGPSDGGDAWSFGFLKMGFSFFVGFSLGYALRVFMRVAVVFAGLFFALMFLLSYAGIVEVHWEVMDSLFSRAMDNLGGQLTEARAFITGSLPSAGLAGLGLVAGYRRK